MSLTAREIVKKRLNVDNETVTKYVELANSMVLAYLENPCFDPETQAPNQTAQIAIYLFYEDKVRGEATGNSAEGLTSESFSEGGVSVKRDYMSMPEQVKYYEDMIEGVLEKLRQFAKFKKVYFL